MCPVAKNGKILVFKIILNFSSLRLKNLTYAALTLCRIWLRLHSKLNIFQFSESPRSLSAFAAHSPYIRNESQSANQQKFFNRFKNFAIRSAVSVESYCSLCGLAVHSPSNWRRLRCKPTETAVRLWRIIIIGDCAANHIRYNGNGVVDCFVINFILQNNERWKGNGKITNSLNVSN